MAILKSTKIRSPIHLISVRNNPCCITDGKGQNCNGEGVCAHHLTFLGGQGKATKECDSKTVPLCSMHHTSLHHIGEKTFWKHWGIDPVSIARYLASISPSELIRNTIRKLK